MMLNKHIWFALVAICSMMCGQLWARDVIALNEDWKSVCYPEGQKDSIVGENIQLPHNWDDCYGYRNLSHGNLHGKARYMRTFRLQVNKEQEAFLRLDGAGSFVTVYLNGQVVCRRKPAGRVVTTLNITPYLMTDNRLVIECDHPSDIQDMPWVCGGCNDGMSNIEGTAPLGLFRNVSVEVTDQVRIEPFGVNVWANAALDTLYVETEVRNYARHAVDCMIQTIVEGRARRQTFSLGAGLTQIVRQQIPTAGLGLKPWTIEDPKTYEVTSLLMRGEQHALADKEVTTTGFCSLRWPSAKTGGDNRFYLNGSPVFINAVGEYEHNFSQSHAFIDDEIDRRASMVKKLGFNTFTEVSLPHNLRYQQNWEKQGTMQISCFSGHVWHDTPAFRENFKSLLRQWVKERRNSPSLIAWNIQAESMLPKDFEQECAKIVHEVDGRQGRVAWSELNLSPVAFAHNTDLKRVAGDPASEMAWCEELHKQMCDAWTHKDERCGQMMGNLFSAELPGSQVREFRRDIDNAGPFSGDGIFNAFWEQTDAYYLFAAWGAFFRRGGNSSNSPTALSARQMVTIGYNVEGMPLPDYLLSESDRVMQKTQFGTTTPVLQDDPERGYLYRYNCGGDEVVDSYGHVWMGDDTRYSDCWAEAPQFATDAISPVLASQYELPGWTIATAATKTSKLQYAAMADQPLLRTHRWGRQRLHFYFPLPDKEIYQVDIYFVNSRHVVHHVSYRARVGADGVLDVGFPNVKIGQAKVAAITISLPRADAKVYGKIDRAGNFTFSASTLEKLKERVPALKKAKGYPYSEGKTWAEIAK